ncbi:hypothetical protein VNO78_17743 [Psophocarpus tetragonolobus]|uniref:Uncharacterized protein n=1 Tax=Psophocarpus tetragonolobus TaxID=3891 RepID=A0AAN9XL83_PSOTE
MRPPRDHFPSSVTDLHLGTQHSCTDHSLARGHMYPLSVFLETTPRAQSPISTLAPSATAPTTARCSPEA